MWPTRYSVAISASMEKPVAHEEAVRAAKLAFCCGGECKTPDHCCMDISDSTADIIAAIAAFLRACRPSAEIDMGIQAGLADSKWALDKIAAELSD